MSDIWLHSIRPCSRFQSFLLNPHKSLILVNRDILGVSPTDNDLVSGLPLNNHPASRQFISLRPLGKPEEQPLEIFAPNLDPFDSITDATKREEARDAFETAKEAVSAEEGSYPAQPGDDVVITSLGTGSAAPGKYRNCPWPFLVIFF